MDDAVERKAQELRDQKRVAEERERLAEESRQAALVEFEQSLLEFHSEQTRYPLTVMPSGRNRMKAVYFTVGPAGTVREVVLAEVEAFSYNVSEIPTQVFIVSDRRGAERPDGTLPRDTAHRVAGLAVEEMAKVLARGARVVSRDEAEALQEQAAQQRQSEEAKRQLEWQAEFERSTRWNWLGSLLGFVVTAVVARLLLYPLLRPLLESWFN
jgi:hypothetical protein